MANKSGSEVGAHRCDDTDISQFWKMHDDEIRSLADETLCLQTEDGDMIGVYSCSAYFDSVFLFDSFQQSLVWIKTEANWRNEGSQAVSLSPISMQSDASSREVHIRRLDHNVFQQWEAVPFSIV